MNFSMLFIFLFLNLSALQQPLGMQTGNEIPEQIGRNQISARWPSGLPGPRASGRGLGADAPVGLDLFLVFGLGTVQDNGYSVSINPPHDPAG